MAIAIEGLMMNPNQALIGQLQEGIQGRATTAQKNATIEWLRSRGHDDLASALEAGSIDAGSTVNEALSRERPAEPQGQVVTAEQLRAMYPGTQIEEGLYSQKPDGTVTKVGGAAGPTVNVNTGGGKFDEGFAKADADLLGTVYASGLQATRNLGRIDQLDTLLKSAPTGAEGAIKQAAGEFGISTEGLDDIQSAQALINSLVPEQRQPGSGPMSDADLALFKQSLPRIINQPGGNQTIVDTMRAIAQYDAQGAQIVQLLRQGEIDRPQAFQMLQDRQNPLASFKAPPAAAGGGGAGQPVVIDGVTIRKVN
jgi:flagellar protein FlgJ